MQNFAHDGSRLRKSLSPLKAREREIVCVAGRFRDWKVNSSNDRIKLVIRLKQSCIGLRHPNPFVKYIALIFLSGLVLLTGCASHYVITLNNGGRISTTSKPKLVHGAYVFKDS